MTMTEPTTLISDTTSRFHGRLTLQTPSHGSLTITYADLGAESGPVLLYLPGMFASRYLGLQLHTIAEQKGVRLLVVDRPGLGGSTNITPEKRVDAWIELFPLFLQELGIAKVALASHSAGTIYLLNTWARCRDSLMSNCCICCLAPWVDPAHSKITSMQMAQFLPVKLFDYWHQIPRFMITQASPVFAGSGAVMRRMSGSMSSISGLSESGRSQEEADRNFLDANYKRIQRDYGVPVKQSEELAQMALRSMFKEQTVGANGEALVCLRKTEGKGADWGVCDDYRECAELLRRHEDERHADGRVTLRAYFAEKDAMVGSKGQRYFEQCWTETGVEFVGRTVQGTDHDTLAQAVEVGRVWTRACRGKMRCLWIPRCSLRARSWGKNLFVPRQKLRLRPPGSVNSPVSVTVSGDRTALDQLEQLLAADKVFARRLKVNAAYHSHHILPIAEPYGEVLAKRVRPLPESEDQIIYSSPTTGHHAEAKHVACSDHWVHTVHGALGLLLQSARARHSHLCRRDCVRLIFPPRYLQNECLRQLQYSIM